MICDFLASFSAPAGEPARARRTAQRQPGATGSRRPGRPRPAEAASPSTAGPQVRS
jgi:hypothetical protein